MTESRFGIRPFPRVALYPKEEETAQMLKRVMTVAELLAKHSAETPAEEQATADEKTQDQQPVVE